MSSFTIIKTKDNYNTEYLLLIVKGDTKCEIPLKNYYATTNFMASTINMPTVSLIADDIYQIIIEGYYKHDDYTIKGQGFKRIVLDYKDPNLSILDINDYIDDYIDNYLDNHIGNKRDDYKKICRFYDFTIHVTRNYKIYLSYKESNVTYELVLNDKFDTNFTPFLKGHSVTIFSNCVKVNIKGIFYMCEYKAIVVSILINYNELIGASPYLVNNFYNCICA